MVENNNNNPRELGLKGMGSRILKLGSNSAFEKLESGSVFFNGLNQVETCEHPDTKSLYSTILIPMQFLVVIGVGSGFS